MKDEPKGYVWEALEHSHTEKTQDWFWVLGILALALIIVFILFDNILLAIVIGLGALFIGLLANKPPRMIQFAVTTRGIRVDDTLYPYATLEAYHIDEEDPRGPILFIRSDRLFMPLIVMPLPEEYTDKIDDLLCTRLHEERLEEPLAHKLLDFFGF